MRPPMTDDELMHFGILGMKWGRRRYQNEDGSLTPAGEARYGKKPGFLERRRNKKKMAKVRAAKKKNSEHEYEEPKAYDRKLTSKELDNRLERLKKEENYRNKVNEVRHPAKTAIKNALADVGTTLIKNAALSVGEHYVAQFLKKKNITYVRAQSKK